MRAAGIVRIVGQLAVCLARGRGGNVAILVAVTVPVILAAALGGLNVTIALAKRQELRDIAQTACNRALKPTRMSLYTDAERKTQGETLFDAMAQKAKFAVTARTVTAGWLSAQVTASARISALSSGLAAGAGGFTVNVDERCVGVPPYPAKGETILTSKFTKPNGAALLATYDTWGVYKPQDFGWDGGTGPGIEIQDWCKGFGDVPQGSDNCFVVELDSHGGPNNTGNSSMYRRLELHRGTYRFSFWYFGRTADSATNRISVYLEGVRPVSPKVQKLTVAEPDWKGWIYKKFEITVSDYSIYNLWIAGEGNDDTLGGNFNDLELTYIKRPPELYND